MILIAAGDLRPGDDVDCIGPIVGPVDRGTPGEVTFQTGETVRRHTAPITLGADMPVWVRSLRAQR